MSNLFLILMIITFMRQANACFDKNDFNLHQLYFKSEIKKSKTNKTKITDSQITQSYIELTKDCRFKHVDFKTVYSNLVTTQGFSTDFAFGITEKLLTQKNVKINNLNLILSKKLPVNFLKLRADLSISIIQFLSTTDTKQGSYDVFFKEFDAITIDCSKMIPEYSQSCQNLTAKYFARALPLNKTDASLLAQYFKIKRYVYENIKTKPYRNFEFCGLIFTVLNTGVAGSDSFIEIFNSLKSDTTLSDKQKFEIAIKSANNTFKNLK